ncbi:AAA family ATPase [Rathayibacter sp. Leaf296]|uniref:AAA family ATPase n=1 Tax=Rathayibacter sp. Leaf296 TaxID=1736327 RepID=UPI0009EA2DF6|nr:AAA family ATPase [Rathayibacter sp. Leaf296]
MLEESDRELMRVVSRYLKHVEKLAATEQIAERTPLGDAVSEHLGVDATTLSVTTEEVLPHRLVDADLALDVLSGADSSVLGVGGGEQRGHSSIGEMLANPYNRFAPGPVTYATRATGPDSDRRVIAFGVRLLRFEGVPVAVLQRDAMPQVGRESATLEILAADEEIVPAFVRRLHALMIEHSVLRGQVLSFAGTEFGRHAGAVFLPRPAVAASEVVLEEGVLDSVVDHVVGIGEHRAELLEAGQHLKRGLLLYGPPGTGKTLTVRHLLSRTPGTTAIVLTGSSIRFIGAAAEIARTFPPALVVLEDIDLVAMERSHSPQPLLFEVLDALDGLDGDADVAFVMTTNRVQVLERALAARPGRVDLGVEIPLPGLEARRRLFRRYAEALPFSGAALDAAAERAEGTTGSFAKELMRRSVLAAALRGSAPGDGDLAAALEVLLSSAESLTRLLLGSPGERRDPEGDDADLHDVDPHDTDPYDVGPDGEVTTAGYSASAMSSSYSVTYDDDPGV